MTTADDVNFAIARLEAASCWDHVYGPRALLALAARIEEVAGTNEAIVPLPFEAVSTGDGTVESPFRSVIGVSAKDFEKLRSQCFMEAAAACDALRQTCRNGSESDGIGMCAKVIRLLA